MLTIKAVNKAIAEAGCKETLERGDGYFYFRGGEADNWIATSVHVYAINHLTLNQWLEALEGLREANNSN
uniref:Uncharacterized protein n=1 Tax=Serratia phage Kevin TaxID=3161161 RepID=A0AAU8KZ09_9CAUD